MKNIIFLWLFIFSSVSFGAGSPPDLSTLNQSGYIIGPGSSSYPIYKGWEQPYQLMRLLMTFDKTVQEIEPIICGNEQNKSVLLIGEPSQFYRFIFARLAAKSGSLCNNLWHVDIDISKIEAGHKYVGEVDEYWQNKVLAPSDKKDVVLYFNNLAGLIGVGSSSNDETGIEVEYSSNITSGRMRSVAFIDKFNYNEVSRSRNAYVLDSFATKVIFPPLDQAQAREFIQGYINVFLPSLTVGDEQINYLLNMGLFYLPNRPEPERSMSILNWLGRTGGKEEREEKRVAKLIETKHPYDPESKLNWDVELSDFHALQLVFDMFKLESGYDYLKVYDQSGKLLESLTGSKDGRFQTQFYPASQLKLEFTSDKSTQLDGFKLVEVVGAIFKKRVISLADIRRAVMTVAQVPAWLIDRDYSIIKGLKAKLDGDVVGVQEGKADVIRTAKNGYVAGRTDDKPVATLLFAGPTGTGKSYLAKRVADFTGQKLVTMDMTSYKESSNFKVFQETLANYLTNSPYAVYLFEEIDKASVEVLDQLYFMMDEGIFYDMNQRPLFARGAYIIMTTNAGSEAILNNPKAPNLRKLVMDELGKSFRPSFLNRFDAIPLFLPFSDAEFLQLSHVLTDKKIERLHEYYGWTMRVDEPTYAYIATYGKSANFGARPMERLVENVLGAGIAEYQIEHGVIPDQANLAIKKMSAVNLFKLTVNGKSIDFEVNPSNNDGGTLLWLMNSKPLDQFFESIRIY